MSYNNITHFSLTSQWHIFTHKQQNWSSYGNQLPPACAKRLVSEEKHRAVQVNHSNHPHFIPEPHSTQSPPCLGTQIHLEYIFSNFACGSVTLICFMTPLWGGKQVVQGRGNDLLHISCHRRHPQVVHDEISGVLSACVCWRGSWNVWLRGREVVSARVILMFSYISFIYSFFLNYSDRFKSINCISI